MFHTRFQDRYQAGRKLARELGAYAGRKDAIVLALPRGGVPVGHEVAKALHLPLDVFIVRKLGVPGQEELAMGAIASGGARFLNQRVVDALDIPLEDIEAVTARESAELHRRELAYRGGRAPLRLHDRCVILIDDGIATGSTMRAAIQAVKNLDAHSVVVATPTAAPDAAHAITPLVSRFIALMQPEDFAGVGQWYEDFSQTSDEEVRRLLAGPQQSLCL